MYCSKEKKNEFFFVIFFITTTLIVKIEFGEEKVDSGGGTEVYCF